MTKRIAVLLLVHAASVAAALPYRSEREALADAARLEARAIGARASYELCTANKEEASQKAYLLRSKIPHLRTDRDRELKDLGSGRFCSLCRTPARVFEERGQSLEDHVGKVKGKVVPASAAELAAKAAEWDRKIQEAERDAARLEKDADDYRACARSRWDEMQTALVEAAFARQMAAILKRSRSCTYRAPAAPSGPGAFAGAVHQCQRWAEHGCQECAKFPGRWSCDREAAAFLQCCSAEVRGPPDGTHGGPLTTLAGISGCYFALDGRP